MKLNDLYGIQYSEKYNMKSPHNSTITIR